jgi:hypothetical protein
MEPHIIEKYIHYVFAFEFNHVGVRQTGIQDKRVAFSRLYLTISHL